MIRFLFFIASSSFRGTKKTPDIFTMKTASALQFHILFFLLRGFLLLLIAALLSQ